MLAIVDYGAGNLQSVKKALDYIGAPSEITSDAGMIGRAAGVILPGVGAFGDAMEGMRRRGLAQAVREAAEGTRPFLGICLGLQLLFAASEESPGALGLGVLPGRVLRIPALGQKVPHMGWNSLHLRRTNDIFAGIPQGAYVYFVHSFYVKAGEESQVAARSDYGIAMDVAVTRDLLTAVQFHPEKSGEVGLTMLQNYSRLCRS